MHLLTGSTGFLGRQVLIRLLAESPETKITALVRPTATQSAEQRMAQTLREMLETENVAAFAERIQVIAGDITDHNFGLGDAEFQELAASLTDITHSAADTTLNLPIAEAQKINIGATNTIVDLARLASKHGVDFSRLNHISTAYVAGDTKATVTENDLLLDGPFRNTYERTKAQAEAIVRGQDDFNYSIYRPSVIVGDSITGQTTAFNVIYVPARFLAKGLFKAVPAIPNTPFDVVPVDHVSDAIVALQSKQLEGNHCFHLTAGIGRESSPKEIIEAIFAAVNNYFRERHKRIAPPWIAPDALSRIISTVTLAASTVRHFEDLVAKNFAVIKQVLPFLPYMISNPRFDDSATRKMLHGKLAPAPLFQDYAEQLFTFCLQTNWGRVPWTNPNNTPTLPCRLGI
jgi:thioester reductase-like protein